MGWWERGLNNIFVSGDGVSSGLDTFGLGGGLYKKTQGGHWIWKNALLLLFERFRGVKDNGSEIGWGGGREGINDIFVSWDGVGS